MKYFVIILFLGFIISCYQPRAKDKTQFSSNLGEKMDKAIMLAFGFHNGFLDSGGDLWIGSPNGLYLYDGSEFTYFSKKDGLYHNDINCIYEDGNGVLWFGTRDGVSKFDGETFSHLAIPRSDTSGIFYERTYPVVDPNEVLSIAKDKDGNFWFGSNGAGAYQYDGEKFVQHLDDIGMIYEDSLQHNIVISITAGLDGALWFTSLSHGGVMSYDGAEFKHFTVQNGLSDNFIRTSYGDREGNIWIGTQGNRGGGLDKFDGNSWKTFRKMENGISNNNVCWIFEDRNGTFWIGSDRTKLCVFDGENFKTFSSKEGETFDKVHFIIEDSDGNIWFGGRYGLWRYDGKEVELMSKSS